MAIRRWSGKSAAQALFILMMLGYTGTVLAGLPASARDKSPGLTITATPSHEWQVNVRQMRLPQVLDALAQQTRTPIHYATLPDNLVTARCADKSLKSLLQCLLGQQADLIVRYAQASPPANDLPQAAEIWLVPSTFNSKAEQTKPERAPAPTFPPALPDSRPRAKPITKLLVMAQSPNPAARAQAIAALLAANSGDSAIKTTLEQALTDDDAHVRAQAISSYVHHANGADATQALRQAMTDSAAEVRLMAVDSSTDDLELLEQARYDRDETIRNLATLKLQALKTESGR